MHSGDDRWPRTAPVGSFLDGASPFGLLDAAGNVWEWTRDPPYRYPTALGALPEHLRHHRAVRGGGWLHNKPESVRGANRHSYFVHENNGHLGLRCAADPKP
jgi:formylglycine-generating enzyme required for sulfatase activity